MWLVVTSLAEQVASDGGAEGDTSGFPRANGTAVPFLSFALPCSGPSPELNNKLVRKLTTVLRTKVRILVGFEPAIVRY